jgi:hypothetical protein
VEAYGCQPSVLSAVLHAAHSHSLRVTCALLEARPALLLPLRRARPPLTFFVRCNPPPFI